MKNLLEKIIKIVLLTITIVLVFILSFIFINKKVISTPTIEERTQPQDFKNYASSAVEIKKEAAVLLSKYNINPYYYGVGEKSLNINKISQLQSDNKNNTSSITISVSPNNQVWYFAYPDSYPALKKILDPNGFDLISDFKVTDGNELINSAGDKITYRIYEYQNVTTLAKYKVTYLQ